MEDFSLRQALHLKQLIAMSITYRRRDWICCSNRRYQSKSEHGRHVIDPWSRRGRLVRSLFLRRLARLDASRADSSRSPPW